jgi:hypothetical protein
MVNSAYLKPSTRLTLKTYILSGPGESARKNTTKQNVNKTSI